MPPVPVPPEIDAFLAAPNPAVVATVSPRGTAHTAATWYDWEDGRVLLNMDESAPPARLSPREPGRLAHRPRATTGTATSRCSVGSSRSRRTRACATSTGSRCATRGTVPEPREPALHRVDGAGALVRVASSGSP